nr:3-ketoacyl-CoA synthase 4-like [Tanacetum cinerariifolium]
MATTSDHNSTPNGGTTVEIRQQPPPLPNFLNSVKLKYVKLGYHYLMAHILTLCLLPVVAIIAVYASQLNLEDIQKMYIQLRYNLITVMTFSGAIVLGITTYLMTRPKPVYLVDYSCYRPPDNLKVQFDTFMERSKLHGGFNESALGFQRKILERSGLGEETYLPAALHKVPPAPSMAAAREEAEQVMFGALENLFKSTNVNPKDIGILVVNCSLFNPTPSLSSMIVNKYKLRGNIKTFNLGGMGCSAGVIAVDLAKDMLQVHRNTYAVVVSMENITQN